MNISKRPPIPAVLVLGFGVLAVSTAAIFIRFAQAEAPSLVIAAFRLSIAALVLAPLALLRHRKELATLNGKELLLGLLSGFFLALHFATWISSLEFTSVASSVVLVTTTPLFVALLGPFFLKERPTLLAAAGMLLAFSGGAVVGLSDTCTWQQSRIACPPLGEFVQGQAFLGDLLALTGALMASLYVMIGRRVRRKISLGGYVFVVYSAAAVVLVILMFGALSLGEPCRQASLPLGCAITSIWSYSPQTYLLLLLLALVPQLIGHTTFNWALGYLSAAFVALSLLGEPIGSTILAYLVLNEVPAGLKVFGAILILAGILLASRSENRSPS